MKDGRQSCRFHREEAVRFFRLGMEGAGSEHLMHFIDALSRLLRESPHPHPERFNGVLQSTLEAQARRDYLRVADLLEFGDLIPGFDEDISRPEQESEGNVRK